MSRAICALRGADQPAGRVTINREPVFVAKVIVPLLNQFHDTFPEIELRLVASNAIADLDRYEADLTVRSARTGVVDGPSDLISNAPIYPYSAPGLLPQDRIAPHHLTEFRLYRDRTAGPSQGGAPCAKLASGSNAAVAWCIRSTIWLND